MSKIDCNGRLIYIEPGQTPQSGITFGNGVKNDNIAYRPEDLCMSVDLQVVVPQITDKMAVQDEVFEVTYSNGIPDYISFLQGSKLGERNNSEGKKEDVNELTDSFTEISSTYSEKGSGARGGREHLGINSIDINFNAQFFPVVKMNLTDVRGSALMCTAEQDYYDKKATGFKNFYSALFHFPYPRFLLTIKGFYGNKITFILAVEDVKTKLEAETGNFNVDISFIGYMYGLYTDIPFTFLLAAPYIGGVADSGENELETNVYWKEKKEFCFANSDGSDGEHICTFIEYLEKYQQVTEKLNKGDVTQAKSLQDYTKSKQQLSALEELKSCFDETLSAFYKANENIIDFAYTQDEYFSIYFAKKDEFLIDTNVCTRFNTLLEEYKKKYDSDIEQNTWKNLKSDKVITGNKALTDANTMFRRYVDGKVVFNEISNKTSEIYSKFPNEEREKHIELFKQFIESNISKITDQTYYCVLWKDDFARKIENKYDKLDGEINESLMDSANEDLSDSISASLGFRPSLENIFRMIFAHLDTFIHFVNKTVDAVDDNRKLSDYITKDETNIASDGILPPFFGYYTQGKDNKREFTYPGKNAKMRSFPEVQFVEDLINGVTSCHNRTKNILAAAEAAKSATTDNTVINSTQDEKFVGNFIPTLLSDIYREHNPYSEYNNDQKEFSSKDDECALIYYYFYARIISALAMGRKVDKTFITTEAQNFHDANPKLRRNLFDVLKDSDKAFERLGKFVKKTGDKFIFPYIGDTAKLPLLNKGKFPLVYKSPIRRNSDNTLKTDENANKITRFDNNRVKFFKEKEAAAVLNIDTVVKHNVKNYGCIYYDDAEGTRLQIRAFDIAYYPQECPDYTKFIDWLKASYDDRVQNCKYPLLQLEGNNKNVVNLFDDEDYKKLGTTEKGLYKQGLLFLASLYNASDYDSVPANIGESFIKSYPKFFTLYVGGMRYRSKTKILTDEKEFFRYSIPPVYDLKAEGNFLSKDSMPDNLDISEWVALENEDFTELEEYFVSWCDSWFKSLLDEFNELNKIENSRKLWQIGDSKKNVLALPEDIQRKIIDFYVEDVPIGKLKMTYEIKSQSTTIFKDGMNKFINSFAETLYDLYDDDEKKSTGAANNEEKSKDDSTAKTTFEQKTSTYYTLSNLYTKWLVTFNEKSFSLKSPSEEIAERKKRFESATQYDQKATEYGNFLFLDSYQNDISQKFYVHPEKLYDRIKDIIEGNDDTNKSIFQFMSDVAHDNELLFLALPVYNNFYNAEALQSMFEPHALYGENNKNTLGYGNTYILMYTHDVSKFLDSREEETVRVADDKMDLADTWGNIYPTSLEYFKTPKDDNETSLSVPAFGVTYGKQNQGLFKSISLNMDNPQVTDYSIMNQLQLANTGAHGDTMYPKGVGQDMYAIFSNRSYTCTVEMMGCMNIMPMMYFQLNNIPMFKGAYMIVSVEHHLKAGDITTSFTGVRISKNQLPFVRSMFNLNDIINRIGANPSGPDSGRLVRADNTFSGESRSTSTSPNDLQRGGKAIFGDNAGNIEWDNNGELIIPAASEPKVTFNVLKAVQATRNAATFTLKGNKKTTIVPANNNKSIGKCATAVKNFVTAGGIATWSGANGAYCYNLLAARGFGVYARGLKDKEARLEWIKTYAQAGDIALMEKDKDYGHICMYDGQKWISDFSQNEIWVYNPKTPKSDIIIMRYTGPRLMPNGFIGSMGNVKFWDYAPILKEVEGGYANVGGDSGGETVCGVTQTTYKAFYGEDADVKNITNEEWGHIMKTNYWDKLRCDEINHQTVANLIADWGVNSGTGTAAKKMTALLGLDTNAYFKDQAIEAINNKIKTKCKTFVDEIAEARRKFYKKIVEDKPSQKKFLEGWLKRIDTIIQKS